ncbi:LppM family (lipo)protein [Promicromonospora sp. NPDC057138]|uniref:LppM family (lipo)protein n=1 Tax=Promicromonospora sp. NPDC057138 TaxID=3346031 RepID=UPI00363AA798
MIRSRRAAGVAVLAVLTLALSGCVRMGVEVDLKPENVASSSMVLAVEDGYLDRTGQSSDDVIDTLTQRQEEDPAQDAVRTEDFTQDGYTGTRFVYPEAGIGKVGARVGWPIEVVRKGDEYLVSGVLDLTEEGLGGRGGASIDNLDVTVDITFPGKVATSNGTVDGNTVRWEPPVGEKVEISARGSAIGPTTKDADAATGAAEVVTLPVVPEWVVLVLGLCGLVILLLIGVIVWQAMLRVRDRRPADGAPPVPQQQVPQPVVPQPAVPQPAPQQYGAAPAQQYGAAPHQGQYGAVPAQAQYGAAPVHPPEQATPQEPNRPPSFPPGF